MNCKQWRKKILNSLAANESLPLASVSEHLRSCAACRRFFETKQELYLSMDAGLHSLANQPVPVSLLPSLRVRLDGAAVANYATFSRWGATAVAVAAVLALSLGYSLYRPRTTPSATVLQSSQLPSRVVENPPSPEKPHATANSAAPVVRVSHSVPAPRTNASPELIVLAEEREAFARFVRDIPDDPNVALALTRPARLVTSDVIDIAFLKIDRLQVEPLEPSATEE